MRQAVFVSTTRTPLAKSHRGEFNITSGPAPMSHALRAAVERAGVDPAAIGDVAVGCGNPEGRTGRKIGRQSALRASLPVAGAGTTVSRFCASGLQAIADAAGRIKGFVVVGCEPDEMGIGPVFAVSKLLQCLGLRVEDIDLWELNESFASQVIYRRDRLGIPYERLNVNGGSIAVGHPFGMTGARLLGHVLLEGSRRRSKQAVVAMCVAGGMGAAGLIEIC